MIRTPRPPRASHGYRKARRTSAALEHLQGKREAPLNDLATRKCKPCEGGVAPYTRAQADELLRSLKGWIIEGDKLVKLYPFKNYYQTMAFVNALAWISHREDHHPELYVAYNQCRVEYSTHAIGGLSENDFICAAKCDTLSRL